MIIIEALAGLLSCFRWGRLISLGRCRSGFSQGFRQGGFISRIEVSRLISRMPIIILFTIIRSLACQVFPSSMLLFPQLLLSFVTCFIFQFESCSLWLICLEHGSQYKAVEVSIQRTDKCCIQQWKQVKGLLSFSISLHIWHRVRKATICFLSHLLQQEIQTVWFYLR